MIGQTIAHYKILAKLGEGGMGVVYKAEDTKLKRLVALKFLPSSIMASEAEKTRFVHEAQAAAALNHPNICTIYEIDEAEGHLFIAMEFIEGHSLKEKIAAGPLKLDAALNIAMQVAEGLQAAHEKGITHRDIKPANIMITTKGQAKIMDFGLAKQAGRTVVTKEGMTLGTAAYMSPEQAGGEEVDRRTDIWALGVVLYEMITGQMPFKGVYEQAVVYSILSENPEPITGLRTGVPMELERIVNKALAKKTSLRYQNVEDLLVDLRALRIQAKPSVPSTPSLKAKPSIQKPLLLYGGVTVFVILLVAAALFFWPNKQPKETLTSIAVLPFQNKSSDADTEYLSDGLAESLIYRLSQLPNLKVSPTSSVFRYKGKETDAVKIGNELGVNAVMSGKILQRGENLTISVELIDVRNNRLLWGEQYDRKMSELLATQREIATEITNKLQLKLSGEETKGLTKRYTINNEAYQLYLKGRFHFAKRTKDDILKGIEYFQQAIKLDPNFALAYARIAESYASMPAYPFLSPKEAIPQAKAAATRALEIDPTLAEAHTALAYSLAPYDWNWLEAEREFKRALELDPNSSAPHFRYGQVYLAPLGRSDEAIAEVKRALELEPLDLNMGANLAWAYMFARQFDRALDQAKKTYDLEPNFVLGRFVLGQVYIANGMYTEAITLSEKFLHADPTSQFMLQSAGYAYAKSGRRRDAEEVIKRFKDIAKTQYVMSYWVASIYAALGDKDKTFAELENAFAGRDWYLHRLKVDLFWDALRDDPRFADLVKRMGLPQPSAK